MASGDPPGFDELYASGFTGVAVQLCAYSGALAEAQDVTQEAFCRAWRRWATVSGYDDPLVWVRRVAWRLTVSRWRRVRTAVLPVRRSPEVHVPAPDGVRVDVVRSLAQLPADQRRAIVLHHLAGLAATEIAADARVADGTVSSWLTHGQAALSSQLALAGPITGERLGEILGDLRGTVAAQVRPPGAGTVRRIVQRRRTTRRIAAGAAAVAILAGAAGVLALHRGRPDPVTSLPASPAGAVTATASPAGPRSPDPVPPPRAVGNPLAKVDWPNATLPIPPGQGDCPAATAHFRAGSATGPGDASWRLFGTARGSFTKPVYADVLGDPTPEAIVEFDCYAGSPSSDLVVVYTAAADGSPALGGVVTSAAPGLLEWISAVSVKDRVVTVAIHGDPQKAGVAARSTIRNMVWSVSRFVHADPKLAILDADHRAAVYDLPAAGSCPAYSGPVPQPGTRGNWDSGSPTEQATAAVGDLDGDGLDEELAIANCLGDAGGAQVVVALRVSAAGQITTLATVAVLPHPPGAPLIGALGIGGGRAKITLSGAITQYRWTGEKFTQA